MRINDQMNRDIDILEERITKLKEELRHKEEIVYDLGQEVRKFRDDVEKRENDLNSLEVIFEDCVN